MSNTVHGQNIRPLLCLVLVALLHLAVTPVASAQGASVIGDAALALWGEATILGNVQTIDGRLFGGAVSAEIRNLDGEDRELGADDQVLRFEIRRAGSVAQPLRFPTENLGTSRQAFTDWAKTNAKPLLDIIFPTSMSQSASGKDAAQNHSQQFLLNTALMAALRAGQIRRSEAGGLFEFEQFGGDGRTGMAFQGIYRMQGIRTSLLGRYTEQNENESRLSLVPVSATSTRSLTIAADFHPSVTVNRTLNARVGVNARGGLLVSRASTLDFGSIDYGGGVWASAGKDFSRVRIGLGGTFQGSKSHLPLALLKEWEEVEDLAREFNKREVIWDFSYGVLGGILVTERTSLNGKVLQTTLSSESEDAVRKALGDDPAKTWG
jgi:hypothetical protein